MDKQNLIKKLKGIKINNTKVKGLVSGLLNNPNDYIVELEDGGRIRLSLTDISEKMSEKENLSRIKADLESTHNFFKKHQHYQK